MLIYYKDPLLIFFPDWHFLRELAELDGIMMGLPTRFGQPAAQIKNFWDATGGLWQGGGQTILVEFLR